MAKEIFFMQNLSYSIVIRFFARRSDADSSIHTLSAVYLETQFVIYLKSCSASVYLVGRGRERQLLTHPQFDCMH